MTDAPSRRLALALVSIAVAACSRNSDAPAGRAGGPVPVRFRLDWYPSPEQGGYFEAQANGYYREAGLDVLMVPGGPGTYPLEMVGTGRADMAIGRCDDVILAVRQGLPLVIVGAQMQHDPQAVMVHEESGVRSLHDLGGKSVMGGPGANWIAYVQKHYDIRFNVIPMDYGIARFLADRNYIQQCFITNEPYFAQLQGAKTRAFLIAGGGYDPYRVVFANRTFAASHPDAVRAFVAASLKGWTEYLHGDPGPARALIAKDDPMQVPALMEYSLQMMKRFGLVEGDPAKGERLGLITRERMSAMVQTLVDLGVLDAPLPIERFCSFEYLPPGLAPPGG